MQKLLERTKRNTPRNAPLISGNCGLSLNNLSGESDSVISSKTSNNNPEVDYSQHRGSQSLRVSDIVYALNMRSQPLMPTTQQKANRLLKEGKAKVINTTPFTIQMTIATGETKKPITLGIDAGYSKIGFSAITEKQELISSEVQLRKDVSEKLTERRMYRRAKRNKLWYREPRWQNRVSTKKEGWLAPSIKHKLEAHLSLIEKIKSLLPISEVIVEVASFDTQKMVNPEISGIEYQQGTLQGYEIREYLLEKFNRTCAYCEKKDVPLEIEHIIPKSRGGSNRVTNLTLSCEKCNKKKDTMTAEEFGHPEIQTKANQSLKETAFMNNIRWKLVNALNCKWTYGYITKKNRIEQRLEKSHSNDAFVIAGGNRQIRVVEYFANKYRRNNRCLQLNRKGFKPSIRRQRYSLQPNNLVKYYNQVLNVNGVHCKGIRVVLENKKSVNMNAVILYRYMRGWQFLSRLKSRVSLPDSV